MSNYHINSIILQITNYLADYQQITAVKLLEGGQFPDRKWIGRNYNSLERLFGTVIKNSGLETRTL